MWLTEQERVTLTVLGALAGIVTVTLIGRRSAFNAIGAPTPIQALPWDRALVSARQVDVSRADVAQLEVLPGIGPTLAQRIVDDRSAHGPFGTVKELSRVPGIGPKTRDALRAYIAVTDE